MRISDWSSDVCSSDLGTGKTRTLVKRVASLASEGIDPAAMLILTFSNRAAGELSERLSSALPEAAPKLWVGSFHALGLDLVRRQHDRIGLSSYPTKFGRSEATAMHEEICPTLPHTHYLKLWVPATGARHVMGGHRAA